MRFPLGGELDRLAYEGWSYGCRHRPDEEVEAGPEIVLTCDAGVRHAVARPWRTRSAC